ncbi:MAG TPA: carbohydrate ABC transporter permease [Ktedonobacteraceae bacterium]|nr:carbohydrate ABC transporter permease [Ktedonobacteraceae bacterium]
MAVQAKLQEHTTYTTREAALWRKRVSRAVIYILLIVLALIFLAPLLWMLSTALKTEGDVSLFPPIIVSNPPQWFNFVTALSKVPIPQYMLNTVAYCAITIVGDLLSSSLVAYAFAHVRFRYREIVFILVLATMMIPYQVMIIPQFLLFRSLGWIDTYLPLIVPTFFGSPFLIFLLRQSFRMLPRELVEAAKLDGANHLVIWSRIILPLSKPALAAVAIFSFMYHWNDLIGPLIYLNTNEEYPISLGLAQYTAAFGATQWNMLMAASLVALIPCILVFFFSQRYMVQGITVAPVTTNEREGANA